jgi:hypothetical protein
MWRSLWLPGGESRASAGILRDRLSRLLALLTVVCLGAAFVVSNGIRFLMPGPLTSAHGVIKNCAACHTASGSGKLSWIHGLVASNPLADSKACLTCHKMPATAFFPHGASAGVLFQSTKRLTKIAATMPAPLFARIQSTAFPSRDVVARGLFCSTCHQEHRGANFNLNKISNEQCRSCHVLKFESFDRDHPQFENYPFKRRTRIIYDHVAHFDKHFPEIAKKDTAKHVPATCSTCHNGHEDKRIMGVAPFEQTCSGCHLNQIMGKERATGPKGIAFLTLPGLDLQTLKKKNVSIGEWPDASEAEITPFMKVMISRSDKGRALIKTVDRLNIQDLSKASDDQIAAVKDLVWEIKRLFYALLSGKSSDVLGDLNIGGAKPSANVVADLTASIPRDVVLGAQQQWLPNLAREITTGPITAAEQPITRVQDQSGSSATALDEPSAADTRESPPAPSQKSENGEAANRVKRDPPACLMRVFGQCLMSSGPNDKAEVSQPEGNADEADAATAETVGSKKKSTAVELPPPMQAGLKEAGQAIQLAESGAAKQSDDLLFPTEEELREIKARNKNALHGRRTDTPAEPQTKSDTTAPASQTSGAPITSDVDPESWAEYGGWYRQDYAIFYRPTGHKDRFIYSWLSLTGPHAPKGDKSPTVEVFDTLISKDAQGSCTKCHSVDDIPGKGRLVNFSPPSVESKRGRFTNFIHEPHFAIVGTRGCLTCHTLEKDRPYLKSYERGNPQNFVSNFGAVKKDLCQSCHTSSAARQDCVTCHKYHVNDVITPIINTKIPIK